MKTRDMIWIIILSLIILGCGIMLAGILCSQNLEVKEYTVTEENVYGNVKIVFLSDLHCEEYGENCEELIELVKVQNPDIIALPGDLFNRDSTDEDVDAVCRVILQLTEIAPTYFSIGNHETNYIEEFGAGVLDEISAAGATVLECDYEDLTVNGTTFRLGGMSELAYKDADGEYDPVAEKFLTEFCDTELPAILLSHRPEAFYFKDACNEWNVDLILSGHTHGGLVRLPIIGGLVAPIQGLFPDVYYGEYEFYNTKMIVTSGLAGYYWAPRMFNPPEICVVNLTAKG